MPEEVIKFEDIQKGVEAARKTVEDLSKIQKLLLTARSVICTIINLTDTTLTFAGSGHDHGGFAANPPPVIEPRKGAAFGSQSADGGIMVGTAGWVRYSGQNGMIIRFGWENPWAGENGSECSVQENVANYVGWSVTGSGNQKAEITFVVYQMPIPVFGAIREKWFIHGQLQGPLGFPITAEAPTFDGVGRGQNFRGGMISWHPELGSQSVWGLIGERWLQLGREQFGYPITDEKPTPDGHGRYNHFRAMQLQGRPDASIYWTKGTGPHEVYGAIRAKWAELGWERSQLGYPVAAEEDAPGGRIQRFQRRSLYWNGHSVIIR